MRHELCAWIRRWEALNASQRTAIADVELLNLGLIQGPPGTGCWDL